MQVDEIVPAALSGERLDRLVALLGDLSRAEATRLVAAGAVVLNGAAQDKGAVRVSAGDRVAFTTPERAPAALEPDGDVAFSVVYADADLVVVDKPAGLVVHPGAGNADATLAHGLLARFPELAGVGGDPARPGIVHRLDKGTSGLLVIARTDRAHAALVAMLAERLVERRYESLVWGHPSSNRGVVDAPIGRSAREPTKMAVSARGRDARTTYEVVETFTEPAPVASVECRLETGRTHQIRVHLAAIGHPVVGDDRYGRRRAELALDRPYLHAATLAFSHPVSGEPLRFTSALPDDLAALRAGLS